MPGRLRAWGYAVEEPAFDAPYFVRRTTRLTVGTTSAQVAPQAIVAPTGSGGITAPLALVEHAVGAVRDRIVVFVTPFGRHAALFADGGIGQTDMAAAEAGAAAIVMVTMGPSGEAVALNSPAEGPFRG